MDVPKLEITYPTPDSPEYGTATSYYDLKAVVEWARQVQQFLEELHQELKDKGVID